MRRVWQRAEVGRHAIPGTRSAVEPDQAERQWSLGRRADQPPLTAAMNALRAAGGAHGEDGYRRFFADLRSAFPHLVR